MIRLSPRQQQVAELLDANCDYKQIAARLGITYNRVAQHTKRIAALVEPDAEIRLAQGPKLTVIVWLRHRRWLAQQAGLPAALPTLPTAPPTSCTPS